MITVMRGPLCLGFVLERGRLEYEGFSAAERSLGIYDNQSAAIEAVINAAGDAS